MNYGEFNYREQSLNEKKITTSSFIQRTIIIGNQFNNINLLAVNSYDLGIASKNKERYLYEAILSVITDKDDSSIREIVSNNDKFNSIKHDFLDVSTRPDRDTLLARRPYIKEYLRSYYNTAILPSFKSRMEDIIYYLLGEKLIDFPFKEAKDLPIPYDLQRLIWIKLFSYKAHKEVKDVYKEIIEYEIPFGLSPKTRSIKLRDLLINARSIVYAPLVGGSMKATSYLSTGELILAVECAIASGLATLIFVSTACLVDKIIERIEKVNK